VNEWLWNNLSETADNYLISSLQLAGVVSVSHFGAGLIPLSLLLFFVLLIYQIC
jgi:hypothetical protein